MIIHYTDSNESNFAINILRRRDFERAKKLILEGIGAWYAAANDINEIEATEHFSKEDIANFYYDGYAEPTLKLLEMFNIPHRLTVILDRGRKSTIVNATICE